MKQVDNNYLNMVSALRHTLSSNSSTWQGFPVIVDDFDIVAAHDDEIRRLGKIQALSETEKLTMAKDDKLDSFFKRITKLATKLRSYASKHDMLHMFQIADKSYSNLAQGPEEEGLMRCENIIEAAEPVTAELIESYNLDETEIPELKTLLDEIRTTVNQRNEIKNAGSVATRNIQKTMSRLRQAVNELDDDIYGIIDDNHFLDLYTKARQIIDL